MIQAKLAELLPEITAIRQTIHTHPELKYEEYATAELIANYLQRWGYTITTGIAKTGISAVIDSGKPGKTVALRADMDGLPILEQTGLPYASKNVGKMHACGHDGHMATLLAVAATLTHCRDQFKGRIKLIFQPAEEGGAGALEMIKHGVLENPKVDAIFGYHNIPMPIGTIGVKSGCIFAGANFFSIKIRGKGGHAAFPERAIDPIWIGSNIIQALQSVVTRNLSALQPVVLSVTEFHGGNTVNVIPEEARITVSLRTTSAHTRDKALGLCQKISAGIAESFGGQAEMEMLHECPPTVNHVEEAEWVLRTAHELFGESKTIHLNDPLMVTEDFAYFLEKVPGCFFVVGNGEDVVLHTPHYNFQDSIIPVAASLLMQTAMSYLNRETTHPL